MDLRKLFGWLCVLGFCGLFWLSMIAFCWKLSQILDF